MWFRRGDDGLTDRQRQKMADEYERTYCAPPPDFFDRLRKRHADDVDRLVRVISQHHMVLTQGRWPDFDGPVTCECGAILSDVALADVHMARMIQRDTAASQA